MVTLPWHRLFPVVFITPSGENTQIISRANFTFFSLARFTGGPINGAEILEGHSFAYFICIFLLAFHIFWVQ